MLVLPEVARKNPTLAPRVRHLSHPMRAIHNYGGTIDADTLRAMEQRNPDQTDEQIGAEGTEAPGEPRRSGEPRPRDVQERLDAALACTFPASDPISCVFAEGRSRRHH